MPQIQVEQLRKAFRVPLRETGRWGAMRGLVARRHETRVALDGISFSVEAGELVGYIGPNGAGKSTTIKTLAGILVPDAGYCLVEGRVPWRQRLEHVARIGVVFGQRSQLWWDLPVIESFDLLRAIYRIPEETYRAGLDELVALMELGPLLDTPVRQLSLGQRMRCDLAASLLHAPNILFLDEPTLGLDAVSKLAVRGFVRRLNQERGVTVLLTTHDMDDIESLCSRVMVIGDGRILADGTLESLRARVSRERWLVVDLVSEADVCDPGAEVMRREGARVWLRFDPETTPPAALIARLAAAYPLKDLLVQHPPIEEVIAELYRREGRSAAKPHPQPPATEG